MELVWRWGGHGIEDGCGFWFHKVLTGPIRPHGLGEVMGRQTADPPSLRLRSHGRTRTRRHGDTRGGRSKSGTEILIEHKIGDGTGILEPRIALRGQSDLPANFRLRHAFFILHRLTQTARDELVKPGLRSLRSLRKFLGKAEFQGQMPKYQVRDLPGGCGNQGTGTSLILLCLHGKPSSNRLRTVRVPGIVFHLLDAPIAQLDRASDYGSEGYRFNSYWVRHSL